LWSGRITAIIGMRRITFIEIGWHVYKEDKVVGRKALLCL
jgi:hypothetical protein